MCYLQKIIKNRNQSFIVNGSVQMKDSLKLNSSHRLMYEKWKKVITYKITSEAFYSKSYPERASDVQLTMKH